MTETVLGCQRPSGGREPRVCRDTVGEQRSAVISQLLKESEESSFLECDKPQLAMWLSSHGLHTVTERALEVFSAFWQPLLDNWISILYPNRITEGRNCESVIRCGDTNSMLCQLGRKLNGIEYGAHRDRQHRYALGVDLAVRILPCLDNQRHQRTMKR